MYMRAGHAKSRRSGRSGLGTIATPVGGSIVYSSDPIGPNAGLRKPARGWTPGPSPSFNTPVTIVSPVWGNNPPGPSWPPFNGSGGGMAWSGWQSGGQSGGGWSATSSPYGSSPQNPNNSQALAAAQALLATNPALLSPQQFQMLQQAGLISNTLPYSSVSNINPTTPLTGSTIAATAVNDPNCVAAGCTGGPYPNCTCPATAGSDIGTTLSETVAGLPLYLWLLIGGGGILLFTKRR
jgi:hypothetical protein